MAILVTVVAAGAATAMLSPRAGVIEPAAVQPTAYFSPAELDRAEGFRGPQRWLGLAGIALGGMALALVALRPPRRVRRMLERMRERPVIGGAAVGVGLSVLVALVELPLGIWRHERAVDVGLSTQEIVPWLGDVAKATAVDACLAALAAIALLSLIRRFPSRWWIPGSGLVMVVATATLYLQPVVIDPLFNRFDALPSGKLRTEVLRLADRADVKVGEVYRVDASRRTTALNAYVGGLGSTKRVVLYDNLIEDAPEGEVRSVVAHELGHVKHRDLARGLLWVALVAPAGMLLVQRLSERFASRELDGTGKAGPAALPAVVLALALVGFALGCAGNVLSRQVEARADAFALRLTDDPASFIALERSLAVRNVGDPDPPAIMHRIFGTHPTTIERIGYGVAFRAGRRRAE